MPYLHCLSKRGIEEKRFWGVRWKCNYTRGCALAHIMMLENDKTALTHTNTQTKALAMMDVRMHTYSKQKMDEFHSSQPNGKYILDGSMTCIT